MALEDGVNSKPEKPDASRVISALQRQLSKHFFYPNMARQRGWEGTVVLMVKILPDGKIQRISLEKSSGYSLLDNAAIIALQKVRQLDPAQGYEYTFTIPVIYRLEG
ncbi:MAG: energy transducer TonB [Gammaproteobacteria bacterium]|nr:energy transducer TonB [Gammaproteobacteria bacterium]MDH5651457.1 energy transducer TonB [Gammaproteobacteria bacterium]